WWCRTRWSPPPPGASPAGPPWRSPASRASPSPATGWAPRACFSTPRWRAPGGRRTPSRGATPPRSSGPRHERMAPMRGVSAGAAAGSEGSEASRPLGKAREPPVVTSFREHERYLWGLCYRLTGDAAEADDLVQETFVRAVERPPANADEPWRPWLVTVALN